MRVVHDARDVPIDYFEASDRLRPPLVPVQSDFAVSLE
jgi:hypothetical protein